MAEVPDPIRHSFGIRLLKPPSASWPTVFFWRLAWGQGPQRTVCSYLSLPREHYKAFILFEWAYIWKKEKKKVGFSHYWYKLLHTGFFKSLHQTRKNKCWEGRFRAIYQGLGNGFQMERVVCCWLVRRKQGIVIELAWISGGELRGR